MCAVHFLHPPLRDDDYEEHYSSSSNKSGKFMAYVVMYVLGGRIKIGFVTSFLLAYGISCVGSFIHGLSLLS